MQKTGLLKRTVLDLNRSHSKRLLATPAGSGPDSENKAKKGFFSFFEPKKIQVYFEHKGHPLMTSQKFGEFFPLSVTLNCLFYLDLKHTVTRV